jgi:transcriptional regulator
VFGVDYSSVSQARRRLRLNIEKDEDTQRLVERIEAKVSTIKI